MKVYLAATYSRHPELQVYARQIQELGYEITSRWIWGEHAAQDGDIMGSGNAEFAGQMALEDEEDVWKCDTFIAFTEKPAPIRNLPGMNSEDTEIWLPVKSSSLGYSVSSFGRIMNGDGEIITGHRNQRGYIIVKPDGKFGKGVFVHKLVMETFVGQCPNGMEIDHIDEYTDNNWIGNLQYISHEENVQKSSYKLSDGRRSGERNANSVLTDNDVKEIRYRVNSLGQSKASVARDFNITDAHVGKISRGELWPVRYSPDRGGVHVETGMARALGKRLCIVGHYTNIFHRLPDRIIETEIEDDYGFSDARETKLHGPVFFPDWNAAREYFASLSVLKDTGHTDG